MQCVVTVLGLSILKKLLGLDRLQFFNLDKINHTLVKKTEWPYAREVSLSSLTLIGMRQGTFYPLKFLIRFWQLNFYQKFPIFFEVKIDIIESSKN